MIRFSVVIPTKNRPDMLGDSIRSVLSQSFTDLECIVSDNHNDARTDAVISTFSSDSRLRVIKPPVELNMLDHWEFATSNASGEYVMLLADRKVLYRDGLKQVDKALHQFGDVCAISVGVRTYDELLGRMAWFPEPVSDQLLDPLALLDNFLHANIHTSESFDRLFPKSLNGLFHHEHARKIRNRTGAYFNNEGCVTPDYSSFLVNLAIGTRFLHIGSPVILTQGESKSNGRLFGLGQSSGYIHSLKIEDPYSHSPLKAPFIYNLLCRDYIVIRDAFGGRLMERQIDWLNFFQTNLLELSKKDASSLLSDEAKQWFRDRFEEALESDEFGFDGNQLRRTIIEGKLAVDTTRAPLSAHVRDFMIHNMGQFELVNKLWPHRFSSALQAAGHLP